MTSWYCIELDGCVKCRQELGEREAWVVSLQSCLMIGSFLFFQEVQWLEVRGEVHFGHYLNNQSPTCLLATAQCMLRGATQLQCIICIVSEPHMS